MARVVVQNRQCRHLFGSGSAVTVDGVGVFRCRWCDAVAAEVPDGLVADVDRALREVLDVVSTVVNPDRN